MKSSQVAERGGAFLRGGAFYYLLNIIMYDVSPNFIFPYKRRGKGSLSRVGFTCHFSFCSKVGAPLHMRIFAFVKSFEHFERKGTFFMWPLSFWEEGLFYVKLDHQKEYKDHFRTSIWICIWIQKSLSYQLVFFLLLYISFTFS